MKKHRSEQLQDILTCSVWIIALAIYLFIINKYFISSKNTLENRIALNFMFLSISYPIILCVPLIFVIPLNIKYTKIEKLLSKANTLLEQESLYYKLVTEIINLQQGRMPTDTFQNIYHYKSEIATIVSERVKILQKLNKNKEFISQEMPLNEKYMDILNKLNDINKIVDEILQFPNNYAELQKERDSLRKSLDIEKANTERYLETISCLKKEKDDIEKSRALAQYQINEIEERKTTQSIQYHFIKEKIEQGFSLEDIGFTSKLEEAHFSAEVLTHPKRKETEQKKYTTTANIYILHIKPIDKKQSDTMINFKDLCFYYLIKFNWFDGQYVRFPSTMNCSIFPGCAKIVTSTEDKTYTITLKEKLKKFSP